MYERSYLHSVDMEQFHQQTLNTELSDIFLLTTHVFMTCHIRIQKPMNAYSQCAVYEKKNKASVSVNKQSVSIGHT